MGAAVAVPAAFAAAGSLIGATGAYEEGQSKSAYYEYLAQNSRTEAGLVQKQADQESTLAQNTGAQQSLNERRQAAEVTGAQQAAEGASGTAGSVTSTDVSNDTFNKVKLDQMAIKYNADVQSWKAEQEAKLKEFELGREASGYGIAAKGARQAGRMGAFNSLLSGASQVSGAFLKGGMFSKGGA